MLDLSAIDLEDERRKPKACGRRARNGSWYDGPLYRCTGPRPCHQHGRVGCSVFWCVVVANTTIPVDGCPVAHVADLVPPYSALAIVFVLAAAALLLLLGCTSLAQVSWHLFGQWSGTGTAPRLSQRTCLSLRWAPKPGNTLPTCAFTQHLSLKRNHSVLGATIAKFCHVLPNERCPVHYGKRQWH